MYLSSLRLHLSRYSQNKAPWVPIRDTSLFPPPHSPAAQPAAPWSQQRLDPTPAPPPPETRPRLLPLSSRTSPRETQARGRLRPLRPGLGRPHPPSGSPHTHKTPPLTSGGGGGGGGGSRVRENPTKWRRPLEPPRDPALPRAPAHARASARSPPLPLAGAGRPIPRPHVNNCPWLSSRRPRHGGGASW